MENSQIKILDDYFNLMTINGSAYVFNIAHKMGIFKPFMQSPKLSSEEVAGVLKYGHEPVKHILDTLCGLHLLEESNGSYEMAPVMKLMTGNYENLSSDYWEHLPEFLMKGTPYKKMDTVENSEQEYQVQVKSLEWMMKPSSFYGAQYFAKMFGDKALNILDLGAGSGVWSYAFLNTFKGSKATLIDWEAVLKVAKSSAEEQGLGSRVEFKSGNYHETDFGEGRDIVILGNVTHIESEENCQNLFDRAYKSLKPGGAIVIYDVFSKSEKGKVSASLYKLGLCLRTENGKVHSVEKHQEWMKNSGFDKTEYHTMDITPYTMGVVYGVKK